MGYTEMDIKQFGFTCKRSDSILRTKNWLSGYSDMEPQKIIVHRTPDSFNHRIPCNDWKKLWGNSFRNDSEIDANPKNNFFVADVSGGPQQKYRHWNICPKMVCVGMCVCVCVVIKLHDLRWIRFQLLSPNILLLIC